jgi:hypothetical protein
MERPQPQFKEVIMFSAKIRGSEKSVGKKRSMRLSAILLVAVIALIMGTAAPEVWADDPVCWFNIELNASDLDVGVRGFFDYEPWKELEIENPGGRTIAEVEAENRKMKRQGFAELFFESGEPTLFELPFRKFFKRFREGDYEFEAETIEGDEVECSEYFSHVIPCAPEISAAVNAADGVVISWDPVTTAVDTEATDEAVEAAGEEAEVECYDAGEGPDIEIVGYEVIVEEAESEKIYKIDLSAEATSVTVPPEFLESGNKFQYEVLAIEDSGNQTITEEEFCLDGVGLECPDDDA